MTDQVEIQRMRTRLVKRHLHQNSTVRRLCEQTDLPKTVVQDSLRRLGFSWRHERSELRPWDRLPKRQPAGIILNTTTWWDRLWAFLNRPISSFWGG